MSKQLRPSAELADEHAAIVRRRIDEVWNGGGSEVIDELVADDYVRDESTLPRIVRGREDLKATVTLYLDAFPDLNVVIKDIPGRSLRSPDSR